MLVMMVTIVIMMMVIIMAIVMVMMVVVFYNGDYNDGYESYRYNDGGHDCKTGVWVYGER